VTRCAECNRRLDRCPWTLWKRLPAMFMSGFRACSWDCFEVLGAREIDEALRMIAADRRGTDEG
jgi:hypothetical protein